MWIGHFTISRGFLARMSALRRAGASSVAANIAFGVRYVLVFDRSADDMGIDRMSTTISNSGIVIRALTPALIESYLAFFDHVAFADHPKWQYCYCNFLHHDHALSPFKETTAERNRAAVKDRICSRAMHGYLAFDGDDPIGWCHAAPRSTIPALSDEPDPENVAAQTGSIVCFVVAKAYRRKGLASRLLEAACNGFRAQGLTYAEAYPRAGLTGEGENHFGPLPMYLSAGIEPRRSDADGTTVVRKRL